MLKSLISVVLSAGICLIAIKPLVRLLEAPAGSIIFFDVATWHQAGMPTNKSRWTIFNLYNPWFVKPYWQFNKMLNGSNKKLHPDLKQLFHFNTTPHLNQNEGIATKTKIK